MLSKKLKKANKEHDNVLSDIDIIKDNAGVFEQLVVLAEGNDELVSNLRSMQDKIKYLNPSKDADAIKIDNKISNEIGDLKILFSKKELNDEKVSKHLTEIKLLIAQRSNLA